MNIVPLTEERLKETIELLNKVFPNDIKAEWNPERSLPLSLKDSKDLNDDAFVDYWVVLSESNEVVGVTGMYKLKIDPNDVVWLGWYGLRADQRGKGLGKKLLEWTLDKAKERGYKKIKLYTSDDPNEEVANKLYEQFGFKIIGEERGDGIHKTIYREKVL